MRVFLLNTFLVIFSVFICLVIFEVFLRFTRFVEVPIGLPDNELGYIMQKGFSGKIFNVESKKEIYTKINEYGFRDGSWQEFKNKENNIFLLGDSFVAGMQHEKEKRFGEIINSEIPSVNILNLSVPGSGPESYLLRLKKFYPVFNPKLTFFVIYDGNDFENINYELNKASERVNYKVIDGKAVLAKDQASNKQKIKWFIKTYLGKIYTVRFLNDVYLKSKTVTRNTESEEKPKSAACRMEDVQKQNSKIILKQILTEAKEITSGNIVVIEIPEKNNFTEILDNCDNLSIMKITESITNELEIPYISLFESLNKATSSPYLEEHLSESGEEIVAQEVLKYLSPLRTPPHQ